MRKEDFYQLAFTQYKTEEYEKSIENWRELNNLKSPLGQSAKLLSGRFIPKVGK